MLGPLYGQLGPLTVPRRAARPAYRDVVLADSPLLYWRLGESSGTTAADASGNGRTGTYSGDYTLGQAGAIAGDADTAAAFGGTNAMVDGGNAAALQLTVGSFECWLKTTQTAAGFKGILTKQLAYGAFLVGGKVKVYDWGGAHVIDSGVTVNDGAWHHLLVTFQSGVTNGLTIYVDGAAAVTDTMVVSDQAQPFHAGDGGPEQPGQIFAGTLDEVAIYSSALSAGRVSAHYHAGTGA